MDPAFARTQENIRAVNQLFNGLIQLDSKLQPSPCIAKSWTITDSGKLYTFQLRNDVFFHKHPLFESENKRRLSASDVVYSFNRIIDPKTASDGAWIFNGLVDSSNAFRALDDSTVQIRLQRPFGPFLNLLSMAYCYIVPLDIASKASDFGKHPIGTGPFQFSNWAEGIRLNFIANPEYFEPNIPKIDAVSVSFVQSKQTALLKYIQGELDVFSGLESSFKDEILNPDGSLRAKYQNTHLLMKVPFLNTEYLAFNMQSEKFKELKLRKAINLAIDKQAMIHYLRNNIGKAAFGGFVPLGMDGHIPTFNNRMNKDSARGLLADLGSEYKEIKLVTTKDYLDLCVLVQKDLAEVGIELAIDVVPSSMLKQQKSAGDVAFFRSSWIADYPDAENYLACFYSKNKAPNGPNYTRFDHPEFDRIYEELRVCEEREEKLELILKLENILQNELPFVLLFYDESPWIYRKELKGLSINPMNHMDLRRVYW